MTYLIWGILNIAIFLFFIAICFKATKLIREKLGLFASIVFVFGLLSFVSHTNQRDSNLEPNSNQVRTWKFNPAEELNQSGTYSIEIDLERSIISKYTMGITYGKDTSGKINIPISAYSTVTGFVSGTSWIPVSIVVNRTNDNNKFEYEVYGMIKWKLLGATLYTQSKIYKGLAVVK